MGLRTDTTAKRLELAENIRSSEVVVVAGTGVALYSVGHPFVPNTEVASWIGLLRHGLEHCKRNNLLGGDDPEVVELQLRKATTRNLIDAAQQIHDWLDNKAGNSRYFWLKESIGQLRLHNRTLIDSLARLGGLLATLNYDELLEEGTGRAPLHWKPQGEIDQHVGRKSTGYIFHIHGCWKYPETVVLDQCSYFEIATDSGMQALMQRYARWGTFLFVGCNSTFFDPNFQTLLKWSNEALKNATRRHFVLCRESEEGRLQVECQQWGILEPLVYGADYSELVPFVDQLARDAGRFEASVNPPVSKPKQPVSGVKRPTEIWTAEQI